MLFLSTRRKEPKAARGGIVKSDSPRTPIGTRGYGMRLLLGRLRMGRIA